MTEDSPKEAPADLSAPQAQQNEMPFAMVQGEPMTVPPQDLYIPPDALEVFLDAFEGPLDLLLYLIKRQNLDILALPIANITQQYMEYIELMKEMRLELAAEYLVMAAMLAEIKSRMLLPRPVEEGEEEDPRAELIRRLQEYERFKKAAEDIEGLPRIERDFEEINVMQTGYAQQVDIFRFIQQGGKSPVVVDSKDILQQPESMLKRICEACQIPFENQMLNWPAGPRETDGVWAPHWYDRVYESTTFGNYVPKDETVPFACADLLAECQTLYDELAQFKIEP